MYIMRAGGSSIVGPKMINIPRSTGLLLRCAGVLVASNVDKIV